MPQYLIEKKHGVKTPEEHYTGPHWHPEDKRHEKWAMQREENGFDDRELWDLEFSIAVFLYPRIMRFREITRSFPSVIKSSEWHDILGKIAHAFKRIIETESGFEVYSEPDVQEGIELFHTWFYDLWD